MSIVTDQLGAKGTNVAELIGLLNADGGVNIDWFSNAESELGDIPRRLPNLCTLIQQMLGPAAETGPPVFTGAQWYPIPDPLDDTPNGLYLVAPSPADNITSGAIGIGVLHDLGYSDLTITTSAYVPLFELSTTSTPSFILGSQPAQLSVRATSSGNFTPVNNVTFSALAFDAQIHFADQLPSMQFVFENLT